MVWLVVLSLLALVIVVLCVPVAVTVRYRTDSEPQAALRWLWLRFDLTGLGAGEKPKKPKPKASKARRVSPAKPAKTLMPEDFSDQLALIVDVLSGIGQPAASLLRKFRIYHLSLRIIVAEQDAADTAISYGRVNAVVYGAYAAASHLLNITAPEIEIRPSFTAEQGEVEFDLRGRMIPVAALRAVLWAVGRVLGNILRRSQKQGERPDRAERPARTERAQREEKLEREERPERLNRLENEEERAERKERIESADWPDWAERQDLADRPERAEKPNRSS